MAKETNIEAIASEIRNVRDALDQAFQCTIDRVSAISDDGSNIVAAFEIAGVALRQLETEAAKLTEKRLHRALVPRLNS